MFHCLYYFYLVLQLSLLLVCTCFIASAIRIFVFYHVYLSYPYIYSIAFDTCIREGLCLPYTCTCVVVRQHALSVTQITSFIFVCEAVVIGIRFV